MPFKPNCEAKSTLAQVTMAHFKIFHQVAEFFPVLTAAVIAGLGWCPYAHAPCEAFCPEILHAATQ